MQKPKCKEILGVPQQIRWNLIRQITWTKTNKKFWDEKHVDQNDEHYAFEHKQTKDSKMFFLHNIMQHILPHIFFSIMHTHISTHKTQSAETYKYKTF